ncbi:glutamine--fructose-6-phosphate transaminase (isomerizing) [Flexilinea flocculi]|jgi:glucosamine--fructose-6-phosphate aminotransferase (isomerizing)|uniref:Glutamine--fructose-6-phosphate aminotransferase [isomerizing] n=1 Tax=Flexilinea flocculi TaxID=1678840 RepID=A0A0S7BZ35_9CHLR|nr:glutamine--fructose-6-phosphate transaminase (isomerizing) [Flexilinea flocculi]NMB93873.1 glutamine--fructose-6-phosphate transaminase (isomerizing) [Flexilinea flocculi]GAP41683.1 glutamine--fructose-6-phosphate transaminase [Flexilinea flocculi]
MCGIVGYTGKNNSVEILLDSLSGLEYRGYDSAGISIFVNQDITTIKSVGRLERLRNRIEKLYPNLYSTCGIGHTRWATHGKPSDTNAHPHTTEKLSLIHNGIIENYQAIRKDLYDKGYEFVSETDTEVAVKLIDSLYTGNPIRTLFDIQKKLEGSYAFAMIFADHPGQIYAMRNSSTLICAKNEEGSFLSSDMPAILKYTQTYTLINEFEVVCLGSDQITIYTSEKETRNPEWQTAKWTMEQAKKGGFDHFMLKEIFEQPQVLSDTIHPRIIDGFPSFTQDGINDNFWLHFNRISIVACGTALHAGMVGKAIIEKLSHIPVECDIASEFRYRNPIMTKNTLVIVISQSGETLDTLAAVRLAKLRGLPTLAIVNVPGSSISREADYTIYTYAGPEISVASTKAYSVQLSIMYLVAMKLAMTTGTRSFEEIRTLSKGLLEAAEASQQVLKLKEEAKFCAQQFAKIKDLFFFGRGLDYSLSLEGSLKMKEISYIHCEAYAAGEMKHGTIALIAPDVPVVAVCTQEFLLSKMIGNIKEVQSRGANVLLITKEGMEIDPELYNHRIDLPALDDIFMPLVGVIVLQLLAYYSAVIRDLDVDKPRNLAKSVTVE